MRTTFLRSIRLLIVFLLSITSVALYSQEKLPESVFQPEEYSEGKNVPYITTPQELVEKMLELAKITSEDYLIDLGSGDGRTVITAAKLGTRALGIEYNPDLVKLSINNARKEGLSDMAMFIKADFFEFDFSRATVIAIFLLPEVNMKLRPKLLALKPGTRIVSNTFPMQEWHYDDVAKTGDESNRWNTAYLWIVPAKVEGKWALPQGGELILKQEFQKFTGSMIVGGRNLSLTEGKLRGNEITFRADGDIYTGVVAGNKIEGTFTAGGNTNSWSASM